VTCSRVAFVDGCGSAGPAPCCRFGWSLFYCPAKPYVLLSSTLRRAVVRVRWRFTVSLLVGGPLRLPCPQNRTLSATAEQDANLLPIIHVFVLADAASRTFSTKQIHLAHFLPSALRCPISSILHVQISVLSNESVDIHSLFAPVSPFAFRLHAPRQRQTPAQLKGGASIAITAASCSRFPDGLQHFRFTRFESDG